MAERPGAKGSFGPDGRYTPAKQSSPNRGGRSNSVAKGKGSSNLPAAVKKRQAEKREDGRVIGICSQCGEEVYANSDGILRCWLFYGSPKCIDKKPHVIGRFYHSGPAQWIRRWGDRLILPDWAIYYQEKGQ